MSWQAVGQIAGTVIGFSLGGPIGGAIGGALGGMAGATFDTLPTQYGPRLDDLRPQTSEYGKPIPLVYGTVGMGGNVIWASDYVEVENKTEQGGKGGPSQTSVTYSYYANFAVLFAEGPNTIGRIWAGPSKRLIYDGTLLEGEGSIRIYQGDELQLPDPLIESYEGVGNVPAFRGCTVVVFEMFPLVNDGNAIPFLTAEVGAIANGCPVPVLQGNGRYLSTPAPEFVARQPDAHHVSYDETTGLMYWTRQDASGAWFINRRNLSTGETGPELPLAPGGYLHMAWANNGTAAFLVENESSYTTVDLANWQLQAPVSFQEDFQELDGTITTMDIPLVDVAWTGSSYGVLSYSNTISTEGYSAGTASGVYLLPASYTWGSTGVREGGYLTPMADGAAASFLLQPSTYSTKATAWDLFIGGTHNILMSFADGAYYRDDEGFVEMTAPAFGDVQDAVYDETVDLVYVWQAGVGLVAYDPAKLTPTSWPREDCVYYAANRAQLYGDATTSIRVGNDARLAVLPGGYVAITTWPDGDIFKVRLRGSVTVRGALLSDVVADLSERAGLTAGQIDVSALTDTVDGYAIARQATVRSAIDALRPAYYFDAVESGGKVKYVKRGGQSAAVIDSNDLDAHQADGQPGDPLMTVRQMEVELPKVVNVNYLLAATDYEKATQIYRRQVGSSEEETTLDLPLVLTDTKGQEIAQVNAHLPWVQRLKYGPFNLPRKYSFLEPTDIITVKGYEMMLEKVMASPNGILTCEAVATDSSTYTPHVVVTETVPAEKIVSTPSETVLELM